MALQPLQRYTRRADMKVKDHYEARNREAVSIILERPEDYGSGLVAWAQLWQKRHTIAAESEDSGQMRFGFSEGDAAA